MELEDTTHVNTPEGVLLELTLAGLGTRMTAQLVDGLIKGAILLGVLLVIGFAQVTPVLLFTMIPILFFGYELAFEAMWSGRTPGKRSSGIRVLRADGGPINFTSAVVRNLLRIVDQLPIGYGVGAVLVFTTKKNQRLGDLAAGTVVVRERKLDASPLRAGLDHVVVPAGFDATAVSQEQLALARSFQLRKSSLGHEPRGRIARQVAAELRKTTVDPASTLSDEQLIEVVIAVKSGRRS